MDLNEIRTLAGLPIEEAKAPSTNEEVIAACRALKIAPKLSSMIVLATLQDASPDAMAGRGDLVVKSLIELVVESAVDMDDEPEQLKNIMAWAKAFAAGRFETADDLFGVIGPFGLTVAYAPLTAIATI